MHTALLCNLLTCTMEALINSKHAYMSACKRPYHMARR